MSHLDQRIADNLLAIRQRIADAAQKSRRPATAVTLVGVTKYGDSQLAAELVQAGCLDLGESRPQQLWAKSTDLAGLGVRWHLIGPLQRNKVARTLSCVDLIHSVDSEKLLSAIDAAAKVAATPAAILLEVNVSGDSSKHGWRANAVAEVVARLENFPNVKVQGLMTMAARLGDDQETRRNFVALRELRDRLQADCPSNVQLEHLSMGMSGDFEIAIEEGATMVRIGSALFEGCLEEGL